MASPATSEGVEVGRAGRRSDPKLRFSSEPGGGGGQSGSSLLNGVSDVQENHCLDAAREKKSAFQITRVVSRGGGGGGGGAGGLDDSDSVDDRTGLDDPSSEMGDRSYQTNVVTNIDSEDVLYGSLEDVVAQLSPIHDELKEPDVQSRFRLVKIGTQEGVKRGRWHCLDFTDSALCGRPVEEPRSENPVDTAAGANDNIPSENICDSPTSGFNRLESHPSLLIAAAHGGVAAVNATPMVGEISHSPAAVMTGDAVFTSSDSLFPKADAGTEKELPNALPFFGSGLLGNGDFSSRLQFVRENLFTNRSRKPSEANEVELGEGGASAVAIDNKIEQAMDLVKSHLMFAVREEVEQLKLKIQELTDRNSQLEYENLVLRESAPQETLAKLHKAPSGPPS